jgi:hypothetical protein
MRHDGDSTHEDSGGTMTTKVYQLPVDKTGWQTADQTGTARFTWDYDDGREKLINLYDKGKRKQWDAKERID